RESLAFLVRLLLGRGGWRLRRAQVSYFHARIKYIQRLKGDTEWCKFVLKNNWMDEEMAKAVENKYA
ncbi:MAG: hypothetical protein ABJC04_12160, partial [Verrucomicrobiota bacterium]